MENYEFLFQVTPTGVTVELDGDIILSPYGDSPQVFENLRKAGAFVAEFKKTLPRKLSKAEAFLAAEISALEGKNRGLAAEIRDNEKSLSDLKERARWAAEEADPESESNRREAATRRSV